jgi:hypothetical protein
MFVADLSASLDVDLLRYGAGLAALDRGTEVIVGARPSQRVLHALVPTARSIFGACHDALVSCRLLVEPEVERLFSVTTECRADLLLVRHPHRWPDGRSLARRLVAESPCPVWLVPEGAQPRLRRVAVEVGHVGSSTHALRLACALGRQARAEALLAIHVSAAPTLATIDEVREQQLVALHCMMARMNLGDMECRLQVDDSLYVSRSLQRAARHQQADLLVAASPEERRLDWVWGSREVDDLAEPAGSALLAARTPGPRPGFWARFRRFLATPEPPFN